MKFGVTIFLTDETPGPAEVAGLVEEYGFESLWLPDHTHIPAKRESPHPLTGASLAREYTRNLDVFVALAVAAAATTRLILGTAICLVAQRDPIVTAKQIASIDYISGGRFMFGVGAGWNLEEFENHGVEAKDRFKVLDEHVLSMKEIWTHDEASFNGRFVSFDRIWSWPKPVQRPHPPILLGSNGPKALARAVKLGAHWLPGRHRDDEALLRRIAEYNSLTGGEGGVTLSDPPLDAARLSRFAEAGVDRGFWWLPSASRPEIERRLEEIRAVTHQVAGEPSVQTTRS
jgi:probable F420-dependent oxidoreductase